MTHTQCPTANEVVQAYTGIKDLRRNTPVFELVLFNRNAWDRLCLLARIRQQPAGYWPASHATTTTAAVMKQAPHKSKIHPHTTLNIMLFVYISLTLVQFRVCWGSNLSVAVPPGLWPGVTT